MIVNLKYMVLFVRWDPLILDASAGKVWNNAQVEEASEASEIQYTAQEPGLKAKTAPLVVNISF